MHERYVSTGACRAGYVIVFEECDWGFPQGFEEQMATEYPGCHVRRLRGAA